MSNCPRFCKFWWWTHVKKVFTENPVLKVCPSKAVLHLLLPRTLGITSPGHPYLLKYYLRREAKFAATKCVSWHEDYIRLIIFKKQKTKEVFLKFPPPTNPPCLKEFKLRACSYNRAITRYIRQEYGLGWWGKHCSVWRSESTVSHCVCMVQQTFAFLSPCELLSPLWSPKPLSPIAFFCL